MAADAEKRFAEARVSIDSEPNPSIEAPNFDEYYEAAFLAIVFAGMTLEAVIYDFAARHLGEEYVKQHIDRLDLVSKWVIVPQLALEPRFQKTKSNICS